MNKTFENCEHSYTTYNDKKLCYGLSMTHDLDFPCLDPENCTHHKEKENE
jgi:hypothetical protein